VSDNDSTIEQSRRRGTGPRLRVMSSSGQQTFALSASSDQVLGRGEACDVRITDASLSRRHAVVRLGQRVTVEDLGSANGTRVRGKAIPAGVAVEVTPGEVFELGSVLCVVDLPELSAPKTPVATAPGVVVTDPAMLELHALLARVATGSIHVLLLGETGVGKEIFAAAVHRLSPRADKAYLRFNCAAFTETLIESELFGHEKGAFTGAHQARAGLLESAQGGTVFLDEVGQLPLTLQAKLLRVLEDREVRRVGAVHTRPFDARVVSATNRDLQAEITAGRFRLDLYFRLNGFSLTIPPLRQRRGEILPLAEQFLSEAAKRTPGARVAALSPEARDALVRFAWPGNIRELRNVMERAQLLAADGVITVKHLGFAVDPAPAAAPGDDGASLRAALDRTERQQILDALERTKGNQTRAAALLGISRRTLIDKLELHNLPRPRKGREGE
jgi:two-component system response regulator AtoC